MRILVLNPGSTSVKVALYEDEKELVRQVVRYNTAELNSFATREEQNEFRLKTVMSFLEENDLKGETLDCVVARCAGMAGGKGPTQTGAYYINELLVEESKSYPGPHGLGIALAYNMMHPLGKPCLVYDATSVDERMAIAKVTGVKGISKRGGQHTLNTRRVAIETAKLLGKPFDEANLIVAHMGGGISVACFHKGRIIENLSNHDMGFTPERNGGMRMEDVLELSQKMGEANFRALYHGKGGLISHFGTADIREIQKMIDEGNEEAEVVLHSMAYRVGQLIGACATTLEGQVDAIAVTGGAAYSDLIYGWIEKAVQFIAPVKRLPGEMELEALAMGGLRVLRGEEEARKYV